MMLLLIYLVDMFIRFIRRFYKYTTATYLTRDMFYFCLPYKCIASIKGSIATILFMYCRQVGQQTGIFAGHISPLIIY